VAQRNGLVVCGRPYQTGNVFCHHIIIIMDIYDDMMDVILSNQQNSCSPWSAWMRLVSEVVVLNGMV